MENPTEECDEVSVRIVGGDPTAYFQKEFEDQNRNRVEKMVSTQHISIDLEPIKEDFSKRNSKGESRKNSVVNGETQKGNQFEVELCLKEKQDKFSPCEKDLEMLKNVRKVFVQLSDDKIPCYSVSDELEGRLFETALGDTNGSIWSRYFKQQQKVLVVQDKNERNVLKLEFGRSRTISCCQTLRFAAMTANFNRKPEEPLCIIFKDKGCVSCCCCPEATYETVPQLDSIHPFSVFTKGRWKNRAELMVKHSDGTILGFIDKEQNSYSLTMGENLKPAMKACLIGFLIAMDVMDRQDAGKLSCYLRPTSLLLLLLLLLLCITIGAYLIFHFSSFLMTDELCGSGTFDEASGSGLNVPHINNDRTASASGGGGGRGEGEVVNPSISSIFNTSHETGNNSNNSLPLL